MDILKYFDDGGKDMSFVTDDKKVYKKYNEIWEVVRKLLKLKFFVSPIRDDKYIIAKLKVFKNVNMTTFTCIDYVEIKNDDKIENVELFR